MNVLFGICVIVQLQVVCIAEQSDTEQTDTEVSLACTEQRIRQNSKLFVDACDAGKGWEGVKDYVVCDKAPFNAQVIDSLPGPKGTKLSEINTVKDYADWVKGVTEAFGECTGEIKAHAVDMERHSVVIYAIYVGYSYSVYSLSFDKVSCKIKDMHKIWNDGYAEKNLPANYLN